MEAANGSGNRMDNIEYWQVMEAIGFQMLAILKREQEKANATTGSTTSD